MMTNRRALGRGLGALIQSTARMPQAAAETAGAGASLRNIPLDALTPGRFQPRRFFAPEALAELAAAIREQGIIEPLIARPAAEGRFELIAGERRLRAAQMAGLADAPVIVREIDDRAALELALVENLLREDLNVVEEAHAFLRLNHEFAMTHDAIAGRIGKSRSYVSNTIRMLDLPAEVLDMIGRQELTPGQVRPLLALSSPEAQLAEARKIAHAGIPSRQTEAIASARRGERRGQGIRDPRLQDANLRALEENLQRSFMRKIRITRPRGKSPGRLEIEFYDDADLTAIAETLLNAARRS